MGLKIPVKNNSICVSKEHIQKDGMHKTNIKNQPVWKNYFKKNTTFVN